MTSQLPQDMDDYTVAFVISDISNYYLISLVSAMQYMCKKLEFYTVILGLQTWLRTAKTTR
jgi:ABC-type sugar transport system substrate-binding protein